MAGPAPANCRLSAPFLKIGLPPEKNARSGIQNTARSSLSLAINGPARRHCVAAADMGLRFNKSTCLFEDNSL
jgi:hypothetical protein